VVDFEDAFTAHVIRPFVRDYLEGRTPNPCVECNAHVRFPGLWARAQAFDCEAFATGHYARVDHGTDPPRIRRSRDAGKDQSYVLWGVPSRTIGKLLLPLGELEKSEVRRLAEDRGLATAQRPDSQEICFVPDGDYGAFLDRNLAEAGAGSDRLGPGEIVTGDGAVVGTHRGVARYTIGQRRGLGVSLGVPVFVVGLDADRNRLVVGEEAGLRSGAAEARVEFVEPQRAVTPGQSAVFYDGDAVVGGGIVADTARDTPSEG